MSRLAPCQDDSRKLDDRHTVRAPTIADLATVTEAARFEDATGAAVDPVGRHAPLGLPCQVHDFRLWFADDPTDLERAKALCAGCPARSGCLTEALRRREPAGVWGGEIFVRGLVVPYKRPRGRPPKNARVVGVPLATGCTPRALPSS